MRPSLRREPFSYRGDPSVPSFPDDAPLAVMDGDCALCTAGARLIARFDRAREFRICRSQGRLGAALLSHYDLDPDDPESWLYVADGRAYTSLDGIIRAASRLGGVGWLLQPLRLLPRMVQDRLYRGIARNRYRIFGRADLCAVLDPAVRARLIE